MKPICIISSSGRGLRSLCAATVALAAALSCATALAQTAAAKYPITAQQRATAQASAARGVPISELAPNAPSRYTVKRGDTLWGISGMYLKRPWRWPELWGMNLKQIRNPHLIYPGQVLWLEVVDGRARLRAGTPLKAGDGRMSPRVRVEALEEAIPTVPAHLIEPFLAEPLIVDETTLLSAPHIVGADNDHVLLAAGDRIYATGTPNLPLQMSETEEGNIYRIFRNATPIKDPATGEVLGYEAQFAGRAELVRGPGTSTDVDGGKAGVPVPATLAILSSRGEVRPGDRLLPEPPRQLLTHTPHATLMLDSALVASIYGDAVSSAGQYQIVAINKGLQDGVIHGDVFALISSGQRILDRSVGRRDAIKLPDERNGLLYVFRPFDRVSYALVLQVQRPVKVGDRAQSPRDPMDADIEP